MKPVALLDFNTYADSVPQVLELAQAGPVLAGQSAILLKPNLVNDTPFPVTTHVEMCRAVLAYLRDVAPAAKLILADGTGDPSCTTPQAFKRLGYETLAKAFGASLLDLNQAPCRRLTRPGLKVFPEIHLPEAVLDSFVVSLPVLKAHSLSEYTGTLKNMVGVLPPEHYSGRHGSWRKACVHGNMQRSVAELNEYVAPGLSLMDASVGLRDFHLGGRTCSPPVAKLAAGGDPWEVDRLCAGLLGLDWRAIGHLTRLGRANGGGAPR